MLPKFWFKFKFCRAGRDGSLGLGPQSRALALLVSTQANPFLSGPPCGDSELFSGSIRLPSSHTYTRSPRVMRVPSNHFPCRSQSPATSLHSSGSLLGLACIKLLKKADEALFRCARPSGVPRGPATSTGSLASQRHPGKFPKIPGRRRGKRGFPAAPRQRP